MQLVPCPDCARHVRADAGICPFCDCALSSAPSGRGRARAGVLLIGAAAITTLGACGRMAVKYGAPPAPPQEPETSIAAPAEPEAPAEPSEPEAPEAPADEAG